MAASAQHVLMPAFSQGCAPLLSQLPTDQLGPAEQHREVPIGAADQSLASFSLENLQETIGFDLQISWDFLYMFIQVLGILLHPKLDYFSVNSCKIPARLGTGGCTHRIDLWLGCSFFGRQQGIEPIRPMLYLSPLP